eukprot:12494857-Alexandrium_andersonii.AAC.1
MLIGVTISLNPQSAIRKLQRRFKRSELELRGPMNGLNMGPRSSPGVSSASFSAQIPNPRTNTALEGVRSHELRNSRTPIRNPPIRNPRNPWLLARGKPA